jgi:hypothetical protein
LRDEDFNNRLVSHDGLYSRYFQNNTAIANEHRAHLNGGIAVTATMYNTRSEKKTVSVPASSLSSAASKASALGASAAFEISAPKTSAPIATPYAVASGAASGASVERVFAKLKPRIVATVSSQFDSTMIMFLTCTGNH